MRCVFVVSGALFDRPLMKTLLALALATVGCTAHKPAAAPKAVTTAQGPECKEIPTLDGKPMRCEAVAPSSMRAQ